VIEFQTTDAYSVLELTRVLYKTKRLSGVEKEDVMYRIKPIIIIKEVIVKQGKNRDRITKEGRNRERINREGAEKE
jgi:hypothetical protein